MAGERCWQAAAEVVAGRRWWEQGAMGAGPCGCQQVVMVAGLLRWGAMFVAGLRVCWEVMVAEKRGGYVLAAAGQLGCCAVTKAAGLLRWEATFVALSWSSSCSWSWSWSWCQLAGTQGLHEPGCTPSSVGPAQHAMGSSACCERAVPSHGRLVYLHVRGVCAAGDEFSGACLCNLLQMPWQV